MSQTVIMCDEVEQVLQRILRQKNVVRVLVVARSQARLVKKWVGENVETEFLTPASELPRQNLLQAEMHPDLIIACGGGRIMDAAKLLIAEQKWKRPFFIAIPTTAGSGSEATPFAVAYENKKKISVEAPELRPDIAILNPVLTVSLSPLQKAQSGIDAYVQAIESLWNIHATNESRVFAGEALELVQKNLLPFIEGNRDAAKQMLWGSYLGGSAIATTRTTGCHALSYYLTAQHDVPHGQAVALFLPLFFLYNQHQIPDIIYKKTGAENALEAFERTKSFLKQCGLATDFASLNIEVDVDALLDSVNEQRFANNPVSFDRNLLKQLIVEHLL